MSISRLVGFAWMPLLISLGGCAAAYHAYDGGCVPCDYCPSQPLPYTTYCGACPTPVAARYDPKSICSETDLDSEE